MATLYRALVDMSGTRRYVKRGGLPIERQGKGSHEIWYSRITNRTFTIPADIDGKRLANAILKQAGLPKAF